MDAAEFGNWLEAAAGSLGGVSAGCLLPAALDRAGLRHAFDRWNAAGNAGLLRYLDETLARRTDPFAERSWARNVIVVAFTGDWGNRGQAPNFPAPPPGVASGKISDYACGPDYHRTGHELLRGLITRLEEVTGTAGFRHEATVDTRPVPDVFLAAAAGLGVRGRNGLLRTPQHGCRVFIAALFTELELPEVRRVADFAVPCAECGACVRNCPTGALGADGVIRVARCRSYLGMECRGELTPAQKELLGDALFGCDVCTSGCPEGMERKDGRTEERNPPSAELTGSAGCQLAGDALVGERSRAPGGIPVDLDWLLAATSGEISRRIRGTALDHAGAKLLKRNAAAIRG